ncbi:hypothetical protein GCM10009646_89930 [Streptomyces aureus]
MQTQPFHQPLAALQREQLRLLTGNPLGLHHKPLPMFERERIDAYVFEPWWLCALHHYL